MTTATVSRYLDLPALATLANMRFTTRHRIEGARAGRHTSRQHGGAGVFSDYREYVNGEDLRRLDWKVYSRTGRAYVRLFEEETELRCVLFLDASGSMRFAGPTRAHVSKLEYVKYLATALSHVITRETDQIGLAVAADGLKEFLPPGGTATHVTHLQAAIESLETDPVTRLNDALRELFQRSRRRGVLLLMSDFLADDLADVFAAVRLFRHRLWDVVVLHVVHPDEERLPRGLAYRFEGLENDGHADCTPADIAAAYQERFERHCAAVRSMSLGAGCEYRRVSTAIPYLQTLSGFLVERTG